jgi:hypothetical protein
MSELTPELRAEIKKILRITSPGLTHGEVFRYMERGLTVEQIASSRGTGVPYIRDVWNSLLHLLKGTMPDSKSDAKINSQVYKELLNHYLSPSLRTYVNTRLHKLIEINPEITMDLLRTRTQQHSVTRTRRPTREAECPTCGLNHAGECY